MTRTRTRIVVGAALVVIALFSLLGAAAAYEGTSLYDNIAPEAQTNGASEDFPTNRYGLDYHVNAGVETPNDSNLPGIPGFADPLINNVPSGINVSDAPDLIAHKIASWIWQGYLIVSSLVVSLFSFAWSADILTGASGVLRPIVQAMTNLYRALGGEWLALAVGILGFWIALQINTRRGVGHTVSQVLKSIVFAIIAMTIIAQPVWMIGGALRASNEFSNGILAAVIPGGGDARTTATDAIHRVLISDPWVVANFGGIVHCPDPDLKPADRDCANNTINNREKYAERWLKAGPANGKARTLHYEALRDGRVPSAKKINDAGLPAGAFHGYKLGAGDKSAVDIQQAPGAGERIAFMIVMFPAMLGAWLVIGALSVGVILAQAIAGFFLIGAPFVLLAALIPGPGHRVFHAWGWRLILLLLRKAWYSLILTAAVAVAMALMVATQDIGWGLMAVLLAGLWWTIFFFRNDLNMGLLSAGMPGGAGGGGRSLGERAQRAYYTQRTVRLAAAPVVGGYMGTAGLVGKGAVKGTVKTGRFAAFGAKTGLEIAGERAASGHTTRQAANAGLTGRAIRSLHDDHNQRGKRLKTEEAKRSRIDDLRNRDRASQLDVPEAGAEGLSPKEREELTRLEQTRMPKTEYEGLRDSYNDVEQRKRDSNGVAFTETEIAERSHQIARRDAQQQAAADYTSRASPNGGRGASADNPRAQWRERVAMLAERARRVRHGGEPAPALQRRNKPAGADEKADEQ